MLLQFNMTNAMSFKEEAILDIVAGKDASHENTLIPFKKEKVLPVIGIYGANASGKSNIFKALTSAIMFVRLSQSMQIDSPTGMIPFIFDEESENQKTRCDFIFTYEGTKYEYGFVADAEKVYEEYLYEYRSSKASMIFQRENIDEYHYTTTLKGKMKQYEKKTASNKLFLATATAWNCKETEKAYRWFSEMIDTYDKDAIERSLVNSFGSDDKIELHEFVNKMLRAADFNISDYKVTIDDAPARNIPLPPGVSFDEKIVMRKMDLQMIHELEKNGEKIEKQLPFDIESNGTKVLFAVSPIIYEALNRGKTITIDEIDNSLHPMLVKYLIELFNNRETNPNGAQLIFNTHDINLLDLDLLRRDQIYFVEKNNNTGESELYSLADFSPRKTEKIRKGYMLGRYGAVPNIGGFEW